MCELCDKFKAEQLRYSPDQPRDEKGQWTSTTAPQMTAAGNPHPHAGKSIEHPSTKDLTEPQAKFMADECIKTGIARGKDEGIARGRNWLRSRALGRDFDEIVVGNRWSYKDLHSYLRKEVLVVLNYINSKTKK